MNTRIRIAPRAAGLVAPVLLAATLSAQGIIYVKADATGANDGTSWRDAYTDLRRALAAATPPAELWVAAGTYRPAPQNGSQTQSFALQSRMALYGGFQGTEATREQRAPQTNATILSGDLNGDDGPNWTGMQDNSDHVVIATGVDRTAVLDGFTIRGGHAVFAGGAGLLLQDASPTLGQCAVTTCVSSWAWGGGVAITGTSAPLFAGCAFQGNYAYLSRGGAMAVGGQSRATLERCRFVQNLANGSGTEGNGGAIYLDLGSVLQASDCVFAGNVAEYRYTTTNGYPASGGAIASLAASLDLRRCLFVANRSDAGGALYLYRGTNRLTSCVLNANRAVKQSPSGGYGGAFANVFQAATTLEGCTLHGNTATEDAGGVWGNRSSGTCHLVDSIAWANRDTLGQVSESQLKGTTQHHCCVMNMLVPRPGEDPIDPAKFKDCTDRDPLFVDARGADLAPGTEDDDFRLQPQSPCVDRGDPATWSAGLDRRGALRLVDGDLDGSLRADMGAFEFAHGELRVTVTLLPNDVRRVRSELVGTVGLASALLIGTPAAAPAVVPPFGAPWFDLRSFVALPLGAMPTSFTAAAPKGTYEFVLQGLVAGGAGAQLTNPFLLRVP